MLFIRKNIVTVRRKTKIYHSNQNLKFILEYTEII